MKRVIAFVLASLLVFSLAACGAPEKTQETDKPAESTVSAAETKNEPKPASTEVQMIGVAMPTQSLQRWNQDGANMKKELEAKGYKVDLQYANDNVNTQVQQLENMVTKGCSVLVIASIDGSAISEPLKKAAESNITVIAYDRLIMDTENVDYYATFDNFKVGVIQGQYIEEKLGLKDGKGPYNIELFAGSPDDNNATFFNKGAMSILQPYIDSGKLVVTSGQTEFTTIAISGWKSETAQARMDNLITANYASGTKLDAVNWKENGFNHVFHASDGLEALEIVSKNNIDIVITDIQMPEMSGIELIREVKRLIKKVRVVIITAYAEFEYAKESIKLYVDDFILKPFKSKDLLVIVKRIVEEIIRERNENDEIENLRKQLRENKNALQEKLFHDLLGNSFIGNINNDLNYLGLTNLKGSDYFVTVVNISNFMDLIQENDEEQKYICNLTLFNWVNKFLLGYNTVEGTFNDPITNFYVINYRIDQIVILGLNFIDYLSHLRIQKAKALLKNSDLRIYEIAEKVGYRDAYYFSAAFKKIVGINPTDYREKLKLL